MHIVGFIVRITERIRRYAMARKMGEPQIQSRCCEEKENLFLLRGIKAHHAAIQHVAQ